MPFKENKLNNFSARDDKSVRLHLFVDFFPILHFRSAYFQQIEEDVKNHANAIKEVKVKLSSFQTNDMAELVKFHKYVESRLEKLTDETQVYII